MVNIIKEETIEISVKTLLSDILEYDNVLDEDDIEELNLNKEKDDFER